MTLALAVLVSGTGRTFRNIVEHIDRGELDARVSALVSTRKSTPALDLARDRDIPAEFVSWKSLGAEGAADRVYGLCRGADLIVMAGFFKFLPVRPEWEGRIVNIHPSLLPAHGGQGCYGDRVHESVLAAGDTETGCTVHVVDNEYDHGRVLDSRRVPVHDGDDVASLAARVFDQEIELYPSVLARIASGEWNLPIGAARA